MLYSLCEKEQIPHMNCGKWIVAQTDTQMGEIQKVHDFATSMNIPIRWVPKEEAQRREPDVRAEAGVLESPTTGIVDSHALMQFLQGDFENAGGTLALRSPVTHIEKPSPHTSDWKIWTATNTTPPLPSSPTPQHPSQSAPDESTSITASTIINSAGLSACTISNLILPSSQHLTPHYAKGTYYSYSASHPKPSTLIYPAPTPGLGGLGTHLTLDIAGQIRFGPDVEWVDHPTDLAPTPNAERFHAAVEAIKSFLPGIVPEAVGLGYAGIRPKLVRGASGTAGKGFQDFVIRKEDVQGGEFVNLLGIESPGLTSSLAIGEEVWRLLYE